jgi:hypothetical protein
MTIEAVAPPTEREPELRGQTIVVIGGSAGNRAGDGEACAGRGRRADPDRAQSRAAADGGSRARRSERRDVDADDSAALETFFAHLEGPIDHVMVTAGGPYYAPLAEMGFDAARRALGEHPMLMVGVARHAAAKPRRHASVHGRHRGPPRGCRDHLGDAGRPSGPHGQPGARGRTGSRQPDRRRLRRHSLVGVAPSAISSKHGATSSARRFRSGGWSDRPTSPRWPSTSWPTSR